MPRPLALIACLALLSLAMPVQADLATARDHFENRRWEAARDAAEPLARAGIAEAELLLGDLYGLPGLLGQDMDRATAFWARAAHKGHPLAQLRLARSLRDGSGIAADPLRAAFWARLAAVGKAPGAAALAEALAAELAGAERVALDRMVADHRLYYYPLSD